MPSTDCSYDVLLVDDDLDLLNLTKIFLESEVGLRITITTSGEQALRSISSMHFDAVVSDYQMPEMDGIELLKSIRAAESNVPFILFTGKSREDVAIAALNNGADFYIQKGGCPEAQYAELRNVILHAIRRRGAEELVRSIVENAPMMIMIVDEERRIQTLNKATSDFAKMSSSELIGLRCGLAFRCENSNENEKGCGFSTHCDDCRLWGAIRRSIGTGEKCLRIEAVVPTNDGDGRRDTILMVSTTPLRSFGRNLALVCLEDITEFRKGKLV